MSTLGFSFSVICFSETWLDEVGNSLYELPSYISKHQVRYDRKGGGVSIYIHNSLNFKVLSNLCTNSVDIESLSIELSLDNKRSTFFNVLYRPLNGKIEPFETFLVKLLSSIQKANKDLYIAGNFNLNLLDHESNKKVHDFLNIIYRNSMTPTIISLTESQEQRRLLLTIFLLMLLLIGILKQQFLKVTFQIIFLVTL